MHPCKMCLHMNLWDDLVFTTSASTTRRPTSNKTEGSNKNSFNKISPFISYHNLRVCLV
jgi:hypothetical protein